MIEAGSSLAITRLAAAHETTFGDEKRYTLLTFDPALPLDPGALDPDGVTMLKAAQAARLWSASSISGDPAVRDASSVVLSTPTGQLASGDIVTLTGSDDSLDVAPRSHCT